MDNFTWICKSSLHPICNLFLPTLTQECELKEIAHSKNLVNILLTSLSISLILLLLLRMRMKLAAVGRKEMFFLYFLFLLHLFFNMLIRSHVFGEDSIHLMKLSAFNLAFSAGLSFILIINGIVGFQYWRDGSITSLIWICLIWLGLIFGLTSFNILKAEAYILNDYEKDDTKIHDISLFILYVIWPIFSICLYLVLQLVLVLRSLSARKPLVYLFLSAIFLICGKSIDYFGSLSLCLSSNGLIDGASFDTIFFTFSILCLYKYWCDITEDDWDDFKIAA